MLICMFLIWSQQRKSVCVCVCVCVRLVVLLIISSQGRAATSNVAAIYVSAADPH